MRRANFAAAALFVLGLAAGCSTSPPPVNPTPPSGKEPVREPAKGASPRHQTPIQSVPRASPPLGVTNDQ